MPASRRHDCACGCDCPNNADASMPLCWACTHDLHRPSHDVRRHVIAGLTMWLKFAPVSAGSSGLSDAQVERAGASWLAWHREHPCPT